MGRPLPRRRRGGDGGSFQPPAQQPCPSLSAHRIANPRVALHRRWGPHRIAYHLGIPRSTVQAVLHRYRMPLLRDLDQATGLAVRKPPPRRYEHDAPGDMVHVDIKKLGRIPNGGGHRKMGRTIGNRHNKKKGRGYAYVHHAVDDHSRLAYSEILGDERKETAAAFWVRARAYFADHGIVVKRVLTDNGSCYRSTLFAETLGADVAHKRTRPSRPQTNGKVERFNRTLNQEWAYAQTYLTDEARAATYQAWSITTITTDPTPASAASPPYERLSVHNLPVKNS